MALTPALAALGAKFANMSLESDATDDSQILDPGDMPCSVTTPPNTAGLPPVHTKSCCTRDMLLHVAF